MLKTANYTNIKNALGVVSGNPVSNRNLILQGMARSIGFSSYEQAEAVNNRHQALINNSLWVDYAPFLIEEDSIENRILIQCGSIKITFAKISTDTEKNENQLEIIINNVEDSCDDYSVFIDLNSNNRTPLPSIDDLKFTDKNTVSVIVGSKTISIERIIQGNGKFFFRIWDKSSNNRVSTTPEYDLQNDLVRFANPDYQIPRIIYECMGVLSNGSVRNINSKLASLNCNLNDIFDTASYFHYQSLNRLFEDELYPTDKPEKLYKKEMSFIAYDLLLVALESKSDVAELIESMSLTSTFLEDLLQLTSHEKQWYLATN